MMEILEKTWQRLFQLINPYLLSIYWKLEGESIHSYVNFCSQNGVNFPAFNKLVDFRDNVILRSHIHTYPNPSKPIGVCTSYILFVKQTVERIMSTLIPPSDQDYPLSFRMAGGLDGSGSHAIYNQECTNTTTKNFILFCFKPISIATQSGHIIWNNVILNSPFTQRPVFLCAAKECEDNIRTFMNEIINCDTDTMKEYGVDLADGKRVKVDILRSMFDGKMSPLLSGAGGASCQMCTATRADVKDREFVVQGFPINRKISDVEICLRKLKMLNHFRTSFRPTLQHYPFQQSTSIQYHRFIHIPVYLGGSTS